MNFVVHSSEVQDKTNCRAESDNEFTLVIVGERAFSKRLWTAASKFLRSCKSYIFVFVGGERPIGSSHRLNSQEQQRMVVVSSNSVLSPEVYSYVGSCTFCLVAELAVNSFFGMSALLALVEFNKMTYFLHTSLISHRNREYGGNLAASGGVNEEDLDLAAVFHKLQPLPRAHMVSLCWGN